MPGSISETETSNTNVSASSTEWIAQRRPIWTAIVDQRTDTLWWKTSYGGNTPERAFANNVNLPLRIIFQQQGKADPQIRKYRVKAATITDLDPNRPVWDKSRH